MNQFWTAMLTALLKIISVNSLIYAWNATLLIPHAKSIEVKINWKNN